MTYVICQCKTKVWRGGTLQIYLCEAISFHDVLLAVIIRFVYLFSPAAIVNCLSSDDHKLLGRHHHQCHHWPGESSRERVVRPTDQPTVQCKQPGKANEHQYQNVRSSIYELVSKPALLVATKRDTEMGKVVQKV